MLDRAHAGVVRAESPTNTSAVTEKLTKIMESASAEDTIHDRHGRGGYGLLDVLVQLSGPESADGKRYIGMRDAVYPEGTAFTGHGYIAESGNAIKTQQALDKSPELRGQLNDIVLTDKQSGKKYTLLNVVKTQIKAGIALGPLEAQRTALL